MPGNINKLYILTIAAIVFGLTGCGGDKSVTPEDVQKQAFEDLRTSVRNAVADQDREDAAIEIVDQLHLDVQELRETLIRRRAELRRLHADYDTTRDALVEFSNLMEREIQVSQQRVSQTHQALMATTTPDEWSMLTKTDTKAMKTVTQLLQGI
jgi:hypothetical protein